MSRILVDSSVWVEMFRKEDSPAVAALRKFLQDGLVCINGLIRAEILSGATSLRDYRRLEDGLSALTPLPDPPELWDLVAKARYRLARRGFQASIADLIIAISASYYGKALFTLDHSFSRIKAVLPFELIETPVH